MNLKQLGGSAQEQAIRAFDRETLSKMPLASLLYYILIGDPRSSSHGDPGVKATSTPSR